MFKLLVCENTVLAIFGDRCDALENGRCSCIFAREKGKRDDLTLSLCLSGKLVKHGTGPEYYVRQPSVPFCASASHTRKNRTRL